MGLHAPRLLGPRLRHRQIDGRVLAVLKQPLHFSEPARERLQHLDPLRARVAVALEDGIDVIAQAEPAQVAAEEVLLFGAGNRVRTGDPQLGKLMLYQLSYSRPDLPCEAGS